MAAEIPYEKARLRKYKAHYTVHQVNANVATHHYPLLEDLQDYINLEDLLSILECVGHAHRIRHADQHGDHFLPHNDLVDGGYSTNEEDNISDATSTSSHSTEPLPTSSDDDGGL